MVTIDAPAPDKPIKMMTPAELKQFQADFETIRSSLPSAQTYLAAEEQLAENADVLRQRWKSVQNCGEAIKRVHDTESYRDAYRDFASFCRAIKVSRRHAYRLMKCAEIFQQIPLHLIGNVGQPLSFRLLDNIADIADDELEAISEEATTNSDSALERLRETLQATPRRAEGNGAGGGRTAPRNFTWVNKHTTSLQKWFAERGADDRVAALIRQLEAIAQELELKLRDAGEPTAA